MIDIHCHLLYGVDDGAKTIEESVAMLEAAKEQGISAMILTPHYRPGRITVQKSTIPRRKAGDFFWSPAFWANHVFLTEPLFFYFT